MPVPSADKRFRRAHVRPGKKRVLRLPSRMLVLVTLALATAGYSTYRAVRWAVAARVLTVQHIVVSGNARMSSGEVTALLSDAIGSSMVTIDLEAWRQRLLSAPWVSDASIRRVLPGTLAVTIEERQPMGVGRLDDALFLIDDTGTIIDEFGPNYAELDLPVIDGLASPHGGDTLVEAGRASLAGRLVAELQRRPELAQRISQIDVSDGRDAVVVLKGDAARVRVGDGQFAERLQSYLALAPTLREHVADIDYVDLRFDERVYVRPLDARRTGRGAKDGAARAVTDFDITRGRQGDD
jgi:cell division protein FtsQ